MQLNQVHGWEMSAAEARRLQRQLAGRVRLRAVPRRLGLVAGADIAFDRAAGRAYACVVVLSFPGMEEVEVARAWAPLTFPYVPGLLTFREGPALAEAFRKLRSRPDAVIFDGQGIAHPRRFGLAAHMGLWLGLPSVGCAKSRLVGSHDEPGHRKGDRAPLLDGGEHIGTVLRTRESVKPVYVSPGHLADVETSAELVLACCTRYRLPEPTRRAHIAVARYKALPCAQ